MWTSKTWTSTLHLVGHHWHPGLEGPHGGRPLTLDPLGSAQDCQCDLIIGPCGIDDLDQDLAINTEHNSHYEHQEFKNKDMAGGLDDHWQMLAAPG